MALNSLYFVLMCR